MDRLLKSQLGISAQLSIKDQVIWFEWPGNRAFDIAAFEKPINEGSLSISKLYLIGNFDSEHAEVVAEGYRMAMAISVNATLNPEEKTTLLVEGWKDGTAKATPADAINPKVYQEIRLQPRRG